MIAVNHSDSHQTVNKYVKENGFSFIIGMGGDEGGANYGIFSQYGVQAYPTNYVLDPDGKVVWRGLGFDEPQIRFALEKLGVK